MKEVPSSPAAPLLLPEGYRPFEDGAKAEEGALDGVEYSSDELDAVAVRAQTLALSPNSKMGSRRRRGHSLG